MTAPTAIAKKHNKKKQFKKNIKTARGMYQPKWQ